MNTNTVHLLLRACWVAAMAAGEALGAPCAVLYTAHPDFRAPEVERLIRDALAELRGTGSILYASPDDAWSREEALASVPPKASTATFEAKVEACARSQDGEGSARLVVYINSHGERGLVCRPEAPLAHGDLVAMLLASLDASRARARRPLPLTIFYDACHAHSLAGFLERGGAAAKGADGRPRYLIDLYSASAADNLAISDVLPSVLLAIVAANRRDGRPGPCFDAKDDGLFTTACFPNTHQVWSSYRDAAAEAADIGVERVAGLLEASDHARSAAIHALGSFGPNAGRHAGAVLQRVRTAAEDPSVISAAGYYFSQLKADAAVAPVLGLVNDASAPEAARKEAVWLLGQIGTRRAVEELARLIDGPDDALAAEAQRALLYIDSDLLDAVPASSILRRLRLSSDWTAANYGLRVLGRKRAVAALAGLLGNEAHGNQAARALTDIGPIAIPALADRLLQGADATAVRNAAEALGFIRSPAACLALKEATTHESLLTVEASLNWVPLACGSEDLTAVYERALEHISSLRARRRCSPGRFERLRRLILRNLRRV